MCSSRKGENKRCTKETLQEEHATSNQKESTAEKALLNEGTDKILELLNAQEAVDIWNRATKLGTTGGDVSYPVIAKLKEMEVRDKKEAERLGDSRGYP